MIRKLCAAIVAGTLAAGLSGCVKPTTFNPYAAPDNKELDRLQKQVNDRPDLEAAERELNELNRKVLEAFAKYSPGTRLEPKPQIAPCNEPNLFNVGREYRTDRVYAEPGPVTGDFAAIRGALMPAFTAAGFHLNLPPGKSFGPDEFSVIRDDRAMIELSRTSYAFMSGCRLPASWRTAPPPTDDRPLDDPDIHFPYLYGSPGGRTARP